MLGVKFSFENQTKHVTDAAKKGAFKSFSHAAASVRKTAQARIIKRPTTAKAEGSAKQPRRRRLAAPPGRSPYTRRGQIKRAIVFAVYDEGAVIGPRASVMGTSAEAHEDGGQYKGQDFPQRPTMGPALSENYERFAGSFAGSIGP